MVSDPGPFRFEAVPRVDARLPATPYHRGRPPGVSHFVLAGILVVPILLVPVLWTLAVSLTAGRGPANYAVLVHGQVRHAWSNSLLWMLFVFVVCAAGWGLAWLVRDVRGPARGFVRVAVGLPVVTSPLTAAVAFRLLADPGGALGAGLLTPGRAWAVLALAFLWQWTGLAFWAFHAGYERIPGGLERVARAFGYVRWQSIGKAVVVPAVLPAAALAFLVILSAATRVFELVLVAAPGPAQAGADVVGVTWWRSRDTLGDGPAAALAVALHAVTALFTLTVLAWLRHDWPLPGRWRPTAPARTRPEGAESGLSPGRVPQDRPRRWTAVAVGVVWLLPFALLLLTSLRRPEAAAGSGWWTGGYGPQSYAEAFAGGHFGNTLAVTAYRGAAAALLVTLLAIPAGYALAYRQFTRRPQRILVAVTAALAVAPPQVIAAPLGKGFDSLRLLGAPTALAVVHAAIGLPLAVLIIRYACVSAPAEEVTAELARGRRSLWIMTRHARPAIVAVAVIQFLLVWNDLVVGLLLSWPADDQVSLLMLEQTRQFTTASGPLAAQAVVVTAVPVAVVAAAVALVRRGGRAGEEER